jgi:hypothetical protein
MDNHQAPQKCRPAFDYSKSIEQKCPTVSCRRNNDFPNLGIGIDPTLESPKPFENIEMNLPYSPFEI